MLNIHFAAERINPKAIYAYVDVVQVWLKQPLSRAELDRLAKLCGGGVRWCNRAAPFDPTYQQRLRLLRPTRRAIEMMAARNDAHINYVERSMDWCFDSQIDLDEADVLVRCLHVKKHHRQQQIRFAGEGGVTRYTGPRRAPNVLATYGDKPSKMTGEIHCLHFDWRTKGAEALRRTGISCVGDLVSPSATASPHVFWLQRLLLYGIVPDQLGRMYHRHWKGTKRRRPWIIRGPNGFTYDVDRRTGGAIIRALGSTQAVLDELIPMYGSKIWDCLVSVDDAHLLPDRDQTFL